MTLDDYRKDFECSTKRSISMPLSGAIVWFVIAMLSIQIEEKISIYLMLFATGAIFPIALFVSRLRGERLLSRVNPLGQLLGLCILMVNLLWAVHIPLALHAPEFVSLSLGIGLGLHWVVYSWVIQHPLGIIHAILRTVLVLLAWYCFPTAQLLAVSVVIVIVYMISIYQMSTRTIECK